jgi:hypothetical protein
MIDFRRNWRTGLVAICGASMLLSGCGGSADPTSSSGQAQGGMPGQVSPTDRFPVSVPAKRQSKEPKQTRSGSTRKNKVHHEMSKQAGAAAPHKSPSQKAADVLAKVKELVGGGGGRKERVVSTPEEIRKVLEEVNDESGDQSSGVHGSGDDGSQSGAQESLEKVLP